MTNQSVSLESSWTSDQPAVGVFVTCLVDLFRPAIGFAAVSLLEKAGCRVVVPEVQTCCGQPAHNGGDKANAKALAQQVITAFEPFDYVVAPSGSCAAMIRQHYPDLFIDDPDWSPRAHRLALRTFELVSFLVDVRGVIALDSLGTQSTVTYHDSCSGYRELGIKDQPRMLLRAIDGLSMVELREPEVCCGFGGTFCVKYPEISDKMVSDKAKDIRDTGAATVLGGDLGCLLNIAGKLKRMGSTVEARHIAELLAGMMEHPGIGDPPV